METTSNNANIFSQRSQLYIKQRGFAFAAARAYIPTFKESHDANDILRQLKGYRCTVYSAAYASFLNEHKLERSLRRLKLLFLDLEAGFIKPIIPNDGETIWTTIDTIAFKEVEQRTQTKKKIKYSQPHHNQRCNKRLPLLPTPPQAQVSTNMSLYTMMMTNIEALKYQCSTVLTVEDYMRFMFANTHIQQQFHKYVNTLMATRDDGQKYCYLEREIGQRELIMEKIQHLPRPGQTFLLPNFNNTVFIAPCSKDEYIYKYCNNVEFYLPPSTETLIRPPTHPGLYTATRMMGVRQIDPACQQRDAHIRPEYYGRGTKLSSNRPSSI